MKRFCNILILFSILLTTPGVGMVGRWTRYPHTSIRQSTSRRGCQNFFRAAGKMVAHCVYDPDISKERGTPHARQAEYGEHYIDVELLKDSSDSRGTRGTHQVMCGVRTRTANGRHTPLCVSRMDRKTRCRFCQSTGSGPDNPMIQYKCFLYAGFLAHYCTGYVPTVASDNSF